MSRCRPGRSNDTFRPGENCWKKISGRCRNRSRADYLVVGRCFPRSVDEAIPVRAGVLRRQMPAQRAARTGRQRTPAVCRRSNWQKRALPALQEKPLLQLKQRNFPRLAARCHPRTRTARECRPRGRRQRTPQWLQPLHSEEETPADTRIEPSPAKSFRQNATLTNALEQFRRLEAVDWSTDGKRGMPEMGARFRGEGGRRVVGTAVLTRASRRTALDGARRPARRGRGQ